MALSTAAPCDARWAASTSSHPAAPRQARLPVHLTSVLCKELATPCRARRPAPAAGPVLCGLGAESVPSLLTGSPALLASGSFCLCPVPWSCLHTHAPSPPGGWPGWLHSLGRAYCPGLCSPATCSVSPFLQAEGDFVLRGSGTSVTVMFVHKGAGASEQSGGEGSPGPQPPALPKTPGATAGVGRLFLQAQSSGV